MKTWVLSGGVALSLFAGGPSYAQAPAQNVIGGGLAGAGIGAAFGAIAGGGRGAATGALIGGTIGAVSGAARAPAYGYGPPYRRYVAHRGCGYGGHWVPSHHNRWGEWRPGHCAPNY